MAHCQTTKRIKVCGQTVESSEASIKLSTIQIQMPPNEFLGSSLVHLFRVEHILKLRVCLLLELT